MDPLVKVKGLARSYNNKQKLHNKIFGNEINLLQCRKIYSLDLELDCNLNFVVVIANLHFCNIILTRRDIFLSSLYCVM